ncbi:hypothetical protein FIBSPDRAFT_938567 [Athelia psychrophila]|uniref:Uncharacterized protein n=1 Tax=Athelia psychrophila TaxID=1759441 RepID=A0A165Y4E2_9AGAM|nr:hypothetical protein FIBSPDRAFT_938567 [Fibularhizoctonia sp. CBS 109695]
MHIGLFRLLINYWIGLELVLGGHFGFSSPRLCVSHGLDVFRLKMLDSSKTTTNDRRATNDRIGQFLDSRLCLPTTTTPTTTASTTQGKREIGRGSDTRCCLGPRTISGSPGPSSPSPARSWARNHRPGPATTAQDLQYHPPTSIAARRDRHAPHTLPRASLRRRPAPHPLLSSLLPASNPPAPTRSQNVWGQGINSFIDCLRAAPPQMDVCVSLVVTGPLRPLPSPPHPMQTSTSPRAPSKRAAVSPQRLNALRRPFRACTRDHVVPPAPPPLGPTTPCRLQPPHSRSMCGGRPWPTLQSWLPVPTKNACLVTRSSALPFTPSPQAYTAGGDDNHFHWQHIPLDSGRLHHYLPLLGHSGSKCVRALVAPCGPRPPAARRFVSSARSPFKLLIKTFHHLYLTY